MTCDSPLFPKLGPKQRGSKPRCHLFTSGEKSEVGHRLTSLIEPWGEVRPCDSWMPDGFDCCDEAQLDKSERLIPDRQVRASLRNWWLAAPARNSTTPNIDIASTCLVEGKQGILLVEAKAHDEELRREERGKPLAGKGNQVVSTDSKLNHVQIGASIQDASSALSVETNLAWALSRDRHYQMSNSFSWAGKLTTIGYPVILVYLGFIGCEEMCDGTSQRSITGIEDWDELVTAHSQPLFAREVWNQKWSVNGQSFIPLIRAYDQSLDFVRTV